MLRLQSQRASKRALTFALIPGILLFSNVALAQELFESGTNFLDELVDLLTGAWAISFSVIAVIFVALLALGGRISWTAAISVGIGIIVILSAAEIVDGIAGVL